MTFNLHAATRRELLIASGTLFAWAYLPKVARAEGRDPRLLVIVLRGALKGGRVVADWPGLKPAKLVRHFVADEPPPALVERLAKRFLATQGDLKQMAKALVAAPEAWEAPRAKLKRPGEWVVGILRAAGVTPPDIGPVMQAHNLLGEPLWRPPAPNGFADESAPWLDGLTQRLDIANQFARRLGAEADPRDVFEQALAPLASSETRQAILRAESRPQALALLFMASEFQRR